jgi:NTP pyrophosphatase (non-canonical NTP hydrolase)|tara:strand:+ start:6346 stop:6702 length:357 start_codon:yes stop_codon:yes gene_type:complete
LLTPQDIKQFAIVNVTPMEYSYWVENKIVTEGQTRLIENTLGLVGEAGEVAEKVKKLLRDKTKVDQKEVLKELGDVIFYATAISNYFYSNLAEVLELNMDKLNSREERGVLRGSGDDR